MKALALRYSNTRLTNLTYDAMAQNQRLFRCLKLSDFVYNKQEEQGVLLNGRRYAHILYVHRNIDIVISADEIVDEASLQFLQSFWIAKHKYIALQKQNVWTSYIEVTTENGSFPLVYIEDIKSLKEVNLSLTTVEPI